MSSVTPPPDDHSASEATAADGAAESPSPAAAASKAKPRIAIGSQRDVADPKLRKAMPAADLTEATREAALNDSPPRSEPVGQSDVDTPKAAEQAADRVDEPSAAAMEPVVAPEDLEEEIASALAGFSMDQAMDRTADATPASDLELGSRIKAYVSRIEGDHVFFSLQGRHEGIASARQFHKPPQPGDLVELIVKSLNEDDGLYELSVPGAAVDAEDWSSLKVDDVVEARVSGSNTGGLEVVVNQLRGFIPASQIDRVRVEQFGDYVNQKLTCLVTEINPQRRKLILSRRALLDREHEAQRRQRLGEIQVGETYDGLVTRLMDFGAFVDIGGVEGLVHVSRLSWGHVKHPKDVVEVGQRIRVKVEKANAETGKFSLSHRDTMEHPWQRAAERFPAGTVTNGTVTRIAQFGAFVKLDSGIEGLIHISELSHGRVASVGQVLKENQQVEVKILSIDVEAQRIALSLKALQAQPAPATASEVEEVTAEPVRSFAVPKSQQPLRGGKGRQSGGEQFGLNL